MSYLVMGPVGPTGSNELSPEGPTGPVGEWDEELMGPTGPMDNLRDAKKAVISFWFRVPRESIEVCKQQYAEWKAKDDAVRDAGGYGVTPPQFNGIIPLLTFGKDTQFKNVGLKTGQSSVKINHPHQWLGFFVCDWYDYGGAVNEIPLMATQQAYDGKFDYRTDPSFIGVDCRPLVGDEDNPPEEHPRLAFCIQTSEQGETSGGTNMPFNVTSWTSTDSSTWHISAPDASAEYCTWPPGYVTESGSYFLTETYSSSTETSVLQDKLLFNDEVFRTRPGPHDRARSDAGGTVAADAWHHVIISFDLTRECATTGAFHADGFSEGTVNSAPRLWMALDDMPLEGNKMSFYWPEKGGPLDFITVNGDAIYRSNVVDHFAGGGTTNGNGNGHITYREVVGESIGTYSYTISQLDLSNMGLPSTTSYVEHIRKVELAELQIFCGVTTDTAIEKNRRAFVDYPEGTKPKDLLDENGQPVLDPETGDIATDGKGRPSIDPDTDRPRRVAGTQEPRKDPSGMVSAPMSRAASLLKKKPEVILHTSKNWKAGKNTGSAGVDAQGNVILAGQFDPTGKIKTWKPDPKVGETVGRALDPAKPE